MAGRKLAPVHPGEVLEEEFLRPLRLSQHRLALDIGVDPRRINEIVLGKGASRPILPCGSAAIFRPLPNSGLVFRLNTIWM
ncbi:protein of unknown function [Candidatus Methylomirabilis oxygeniifera]|uniref:Addiction module antidote protein, HigA family n=1 Tax=Methylomirabilis oxygeniifera TaxID=671143 RepID=D5MFK8_METO1|nr:protein of unknown function [Candidatus Methylomirabilis oxyfera]